MGFSKGVSGNYRGRPRGAKDKRTEMRSLFAAKSEDLINKVIELALAGDTTALKLAVDRIVSPIKPTAQPIKLKLPKGGDLSAYGQAILNATAKGDLPPDTAAQLLTALGAQCRIVELDTLIKRIEALEENEGH